AGNGIAIWNEGADLKASLYSAATGLWSTAQIIDTASTFIGNVALDVDSAGNAIAAWTQGTGGLEGGSSTVFARFYNPATGWSSSVQTIGSGVGFGPISAAINGGVATVAYTLTSAGLDPKRLYVA